MRQRLRSLCLLLALSITWTCDLQARTLVMDLPPGSVSSLEEVYPLSLRSQAQIRDQIEATSLVCLPRLAEGDPAGSQGCCFWVDPEAKPAVFSGSDSCYLYMSLQR